MTDGPACVSAERPITLDARQVVATLAGHMTQVRRVMKPQPATPPQQHQYPSGIWGWWSDTPHKHGTSMAHICPYGRPGDRLWVRETWGIGTRPDPHEGWRDGIEYKADALSLQVGESLPLYAVDTPKGVCLDDYSTGRWKSPRSMLRWASRLTLEVVSVRAERLQDISPHELSTTDLLAAGLPRHNFGSDYSTGLERYVLLEDFKRLWDATNGKTHPWVSNPWVWRVAFRVVPGC